MFFSQALRHLNEFIVTQAGILHASDMLERIGQLFTIYA